MEELENIVEYSRFKKALDTELQKSAEGFVRIGYLLKVARDTEVLYESGYGSVAEFAQAEYGLTKDIVSRYIAINDRYSEGGYSQQLREQYREYGVAKLAEMLTLSDEVIESMSPELTRKEIQEVKKAIKEEEQVTDLEVVLEGEKEVQQFMDSLLQKALHQYCYENREIYVKLYQAVNNTVYDGTNFPVVEKILDAMAPSGISMVMVRIQGIGKLMVSIRGKDNDVEVVNVRNNEKEVYTWDAFINCLEKLTIPLQKAEESWEELYGEPFQSQAAEKRVEKAEKTPEVAPVQPSVPEEKGEHKTPDGIPEAKSEQELQVPGQREIYEYPEYIPEEMKTPENSEKLEKAEKTPEVASVQPSVFTEAAEETKSEEQVQEPEDVQKEVISRNSEEKQQEAWKLEDTAEELCRLIVEKDYISAKRKCQELLWYLDKEAAYEKQQI